MKKFTWNEGQQRGLDAFQDWRKNPNRPFCLQGFGGTGKSTITDEFLNILGSDVRVLCMGPTGKSARVLTQKTGRPSSTAHKALYTPKRDEISNLKVKLTEIYTEEHVDEEIIAQIEQRIDELEKDGSSVSFVLKMGAGEGADVLLVDEYSMIPENIHKDILSIGKPLIMVGDPGQLPPVKARAGWDSIEPDVVLEKIERTSGEGAGINLAAQAVRLDRPMENGPGFQMHPKKSLDWEHYSSADVVLAGTHVVRKHLNKGIRRFLGRPEGYPVEGDVLMCLSNNPAFGVVNGTMFKVLKILRDSPKTVTALVEDDVGSEIILPFWKQTLMDDEVSTSKVPFSAVPAVWGNCITVHKSQGSEWPHVIVTDSWRGSDYDRWLYTAITRGSRHVDFVR